MEFALKLDHPGRNGTLKTIEWAPGAPGEGELRIRHDCVGVNFIDSYFRIGLYPLADPAIPGVEGVGTIEEIGPGVTGFSLGQRVAYCAQPGGFATSRLLPAWRALALPDEIGVEVAAASMLRGMTAQMLLKHVYPVCETSSDSRSRLCRRPRRPPDAMGQGARRDGHRHSEHARESRDLSRSRRGSRDCRAGCGLGFRGKRAHPGARCGFRH